MKKIAVFAAVFIILWFIAIKIQEFQRLPAASQLIDERIKELKATGFDKLAAMIGKGYVQENIVRNGITYYMGYVVSKPDAIKGLHSNNSKEVIANLKPGEAVNELEINGYVDCITIIPFIYFKMGPSFRLNINDKGEINILRNE